jgi:hypothetical protein
MRSCQQPEEEHANDFADGFPFSFLTSQELSRGCGAP